MSGLLESKTQSGNKAFVGRQPIFTPNLDVYGYELLFRDGEKNAAAVKDGDYATANVVLNSLTDVGLDVLTESKRAFINLTRSLLLDANLSCLPANRMVLEVLEDIEPDEAVLAAVGRLADEGYTIALDDFIYCPDVEPLVKLADIVKIEFPQIPREELADHISSLRKLGVQTILAEKLETHEEFELCKQLGCDLFQGYFFCRPQVINRRRVSSNVSSVLRLISELQDPSITIGSVTQLVKTDASLSYKLLRFVNSADSAVLTEIESIEHAITLLGLNRLRSLASMMLLASVDEDKPQELTKTAMIRAKFCELLAERAGHESPDRFFTIGLLSVMDAMLDLPMQEVIELLPLSQDMNEALTSLSGPMGTTLATALRIETGDNLSDEESDIGGAYVEALQWNTQLA